MSSIILSMHVFIMNEKKRKREENHKAKSNAKNQICGHEKFVNANTQLSQRKQNVCVLHEQTENGDEKNRHTHNAKHSERASEQRKRSTPQTL